MRIPFVLLEKSIGEIETMLSEKLRVVGKNEKKFVVLRKDQWSRLRECMDNKKLTTLNEASSVATLAYSTIISNGSSAKGTPAGNMAVVAAVMSLYNAEPGLASGLAYLLN